MSALLRENPQQQVLNPDPARSPAVLEETMQIGVVGLGTMGRNLLLNITDHGFRAAGYDKSAQAVQATQALGKGRTLYATADLATFVNCLEHPRAVILLVPAGVVDKVLADLVPLLSAGDIVIDGGNSHFRDTEWREQTLAAQGVHFLGMGISGGEAGARHGPSLMPGGWVEAYRRVQPILEAVAARVNGDPCVAYLGPRSAGHFVKMVHNGIEYGLMQLIAESYHLLKVGLGLDDDHLADLFDGWNRGELNSYLLEITADIFTRRDQETGKRLVDLIRDEAAQLGTGMWTSQAAMNLSVPTPTIDAAVSARTISDYLEERQAAAQVYSDPTPLIPQAAFVERLRQALHVAMILTYAQGFSLLHQASQAHDYNLDLATVARIWRGGCIIRSSLLETFRQTLASKPRLPNLLLDADLAQIVQAGEPALRLVVANTASMGIPAPAFMASLAYFDAYRSPWLPANLIQAQRDYFGAHTYERVDRAGSFHTQW